MEQNVEFYEVPVIFLVYPSLMYIHTYHICPLQSKSRDSHHVIDRNDILQTRLCQTTVSENCDVIQR